MSDKNEKKAPYTVAKGALVSAVADVCVVTVDTPYEDVLKWDREGRRVTFAHEKGSFKELSPAELDDLSAFTKSVYAAMRQMNAIHDPAQEEFAKRISFPATDAMKFGGAYNRFKGVKLVKGLHHNFFRPDQLDVMMESGWRYPKDEEVVSGATKRNGHYEVATISTGLTEQVMLVRDEEELGRAEIDFATDRLTQGERREEEIREGINATTGYKATMAKDEDS